MTDFLDSTQKGGTFIITISNPTRANVLSYASLLKLEQLLDQCEKDKMIHALILTGAGTKVFCAGADINDWSNLSPREFANDWVRWGHGVFNRLARLRCPTIAAINGHAYGGGLELAAACDLRIADRNALFALPEPQLGIIPGWSGTQRLARELPPALMRELLFCAAKLDAERMYHCGFINQLTTSESLMDVAIDLTKAIQRTAPMAVETAKLAINIALDEERSAAVEALSAAALAATQDANEGVKSFKEKRQPNFKGE